MQYYPKSSNQWNSGNNLQILDFKSNKKNYKFKLWLSSEVCSEVASCWIDLDIFYSEVSYRSRVRL